MTDPDNPLAQPIVFGDYRITVNGEPIGLVADRVTVALDPDAAVALPTLRRVETETQ